MTDDDTFRGPALQAVRVDDAEALRQLRAEQVARLHTVRTHEVWDWFGGLPGWEICPPAMFGTIGFLLLVPAAIVAAGCTRGPVLWSIAALAALAILPQLFVFLPRRRAVLARYRRADLVPAAVLAAEPEASDPANEKLRGVWALIGGTMTPDGLRGLVATAQRVQRMVAGTEATPNDLAAFVANVRADATQMRADGSRTPVPGSLGAGLEYARLHLSPNLLPEGRLTSRLLFAFRDPKNAGPGSTSVLQASLWGEGVDALCAAFPSEVRA